ncbi:pleckstrin homology domain-containing family G member 7 [Hypomesus transpacificus]|uniref:pleckstrin homology domain-containing family G member 7 n=1 Tax=Hypomesus transpacificus TaxID=137520 RepID=UPI001F07E525|nr:pleckstrin homology domain-containing family G member 7 [Hypomesus transpacificus]XP_046890162.1 pleckstrin homology domain-containing family G member 7 [Hypomesus transpacificus]
MSETALKQVTVLKENGQDGEKTLDWSYIEWHQNEDLVSKGVSEVQTQTTAGSREDKETQTSNPVIMHIDLTRTHSKLKQSLSLDSDSLVAPLFQFDRQAPARISTSPTLRRMRSTRRPIMDFRDSMRMESTQEEASLGDTFSPIGPLSPPHRLMSPLAASPLSDTGSHHDSAPDSSSSQDNPRFSHRSKTLDNGMVHTRQASLNARQSSSKDCLDREDQEKEPCHKRLQERRRSSVVVSLPGLDVSPGDLFVSNGVADILNSSNFSDTKKSKWPFSRRSTKKGKAQTRTAADVEKCLSGEQVQDWRDSDFQKYKDCSLGEFLQDQSLQRRPDSDPRDYKKQEAIWELFTSECVYFLDQLMVLKEVFQTTLVNLQVQDCLSDVDSWRLFANLKELCLVSYGFLCTLLHAIRDSWGSSETEGEGSLLDLLTKAFRENICCCLQKYCLNYSTALLYVDSLKHREDFGSYVKWCERNQQCRRLQLRDLLVAPLQRLTRYPLLLRNVGKRSRAEEEEGALRRVAEQVETSICDLEGKVKWLENYQKVKQLRDALVWLPVWERDKRAFVPENLKHLVKAVTLENLISHRSLLFEGRLVLTDNPKLIDVYLFLFDEFLLITKIKRNKKKAVGEQNSLRPAQSQELEQLLKEGCTFTVLDQPVSLDRLQMKNVDQLNATASGLPHSFILMHQNRYQQYIGAFILQAPSESVKRVWMSKLEGAVAALLKIDAQQPRVKNSESSQI